VDQIIDPGGMFAFAAKWVGQRGTEFLSDHHDGHEAMVKRAWQLLDEADAVLHFNGESFDVPHLNREFMEAGMAPPSPFKQIDLLKTVRKQGRFLSNKLAHVSKQLGLDGKVSHEGFRLWIKCLEGDEAAWKRMRRYNIRDVTLLEDAYKILQPWIVSHPSYGALAGEDVCPRCGGSDLVWRGYATTASSRFRRFQCKGCGGWGRSSMRDAKTGLTQIA
jgi:hypothetical protein